MKANPPSVRAFGERAIDFAKNHIPQFPELTNREKKVILFGVGLALIAGGLIALFAGNPLSAQETQAISNTITNNDLLTNPASKFFVH